MIADSQIPDVYFYRKLPDDVWDLEQIDTNNNVRFAKV
ncbi:hypothetical protein CLV96_3522 [Leptospira meyeri]|uniref:Uncharacterized protein n=1 Tax=Leptospira meyeri TaxID=29508 RepID=A0A4R8MLG5_LEPME|nr:hypothetical protein CLV96_3522 [Leptospira meyeri]